MEVCQKDHNITLVIGNICATKEKDYGTCEVTKFHKNLVIILIVKKKIHNKFTRHFIPQGDSGGPLVDQNKTTLLGVVSGGFVDCKSGKPNVYTEVSRFLPYIQSELNYSPENPGSASRNPSVMNDNFDDSLDDSENDFSAFM